MGRFSAFRPHRTLERSETVHRGSPGPSRIALVLVARCDERVHFSPSRTSRPVGCRSKDRGGDRVAPSGRFRSDPRLPACSPDGIVVARGRELKIRVRPVASACGYPVGVWGLVLDSMGPVRLLVTVSSDRLRLYARRRRFSFGYFQDPS